MSKLSNMTPSGLETVSPQTGAVADDGAAVLHEMPETFTDVLYLTNNGRIPAEIKRLLKHRMLSFIILPIDKFGQVLNRIDLIGTVIIEPEGLRVSQQHKLAWIIESLEMSNVGVILLNSRVRSPVRSFLPAGPPVKSFVLTSSVDAVSVEELWLRISVNLAYRKKGYEIAARSPLPPLQVQRIHTNNLAEKLKMAGALVDNLAEQLRMAGLVQRDFLPPQLPNTERLRWAATFMPAEWVSGDIYDIARVDEQHIGFYVADAVGHAMPAALLTIFLKQALVMRETIDNNYRIYSPAEVMRNLNMRMSAQKLSGYQFATCCYFLLNVKTLQMTYSRAGHPFPILIRHEQPPELLEIPGPLLGIFEQGEYFQQTVQLQGGDKLFVYSDGAEPFIGACDQNARFNFSQEFRELTALPVADMMDRFNAIVRSKKISPGEVDDITAVGLEIL